MSKQLFAQLDSGPLVPVVATAEGHIEVAIHSPRMPFGEVHVESADMAFQADAVYGLNTTLVNTTTGIVGGGSTSAVVAGTGDLFKCSTGTTALSFASIQSRNRLRYRPGQGVSLRFTMMFSTPVASSILVAGGGTAESGFYFGYNGTSFGILHVTDGVREIQTLTVTTASTATNNYQVTLADTSHTVSATANASTVLTAKEIAAGTYPGWTAQAIGSTVVFLADSARAYTGTFSLAQSGAGTPAAGSFVETLAGAASNDTWYPQSTWNGDKLDGTGASAITLDPSKLNVAQIDIQYLGAGAVVFKIEVAPTEGNNADLVVVHTLRFPNTRTTPSVSQPTFPFTMAAYSAGSTTNVWVASASFAGYVAGKKKLIGPRISYDRDTSNFVGSTAATYYPIFTITNALVYKGRANQTVVTLLSLSASHDDATPVSIDILKNATLVGTPSFAAYSTNSCTLVDTAATTATIAANEQKIFSMKVGQSSNELVVFADEITLQPGESITVAGRAVTGTATYVSACLNTREDQ